MRRMFPERDRRKFTFIPRYWDPEKEEREARERRVKAELGISDSDRSTYIPDMRGKLTGMYRERREARKGLDGRYAIRLFLILISIFLVGFYLFSRNSEGIMRFFGV